MKRVYANYSEEEYNLIVAESEKLGFSPSAYVKYRSLLGVTNKNEYDLVVLINKMYENLRSMESGTKFIVSALVPDEWVKLTRSQKMTLSKKLSKHVDSNLHEFERCEEKLSNGTIIYKKL